MNIKKYKIEILIIITGIILFIPFLGQVHLFDWDEINFAEAAREMIETGDYLTVRIDFQPFHEKPPLFIWMQVVSMKIFGVNEFAARFPNAVTGIITLLIIFRIGKKLFDFKFGLFWVLAYIGSILPHFYFRTGIIDPAFNLFIFLGIYFLSKHYYLIQNETKSFDKTNTFTSLRIEQVQSDSYKNIFYSGLFISLAVLTKGPVGFLLPALCLIVYWFLKRKTMKFPVYNSLIITVISFIPFVFWYLTVIFTNKSGSIFSEFIMYQIRLLTTNDAGHGGPIYYHAVIILFGCFPSSIFMLRSFRKQPADNTEQSIFKQWNIILFGVVLAVFSLVETKIIHYSSLAYFPVTFLAAYSVYSIVVRSIPWKRSTNWLLGILGVLLSVFLIGFPLIMMNIKAFLPSITDKLTNSILRSNVTWDGYEILPGILFFLSLILCLVLFQKKKYLEGFLVSFVSVVILLFTFLPILTPKIESYTQQAPVEFYQHLNYFDCYISALGYKSYAPYFYGEKKKENSRYYNPFIPKEEEKWLLTGNLDKPAFFVCKITSINDYIGKYDDLKLLYKKNGFVFMVREPRIEFK